MEYSPKLKLQRPPDTDHRGDKGGLNKVAIICIAVTVVVLIIAGWLFWENRNLSKKADSPTQTSQADTTNEDIIKKVSEVYDAPNEKPSVAQVADKEKLSNQPFFQNAKDGDYLLIYPKAKVALIYRLSENKVVNIGPISTAQ